MSDPRPDNDVEQALTEWAHQVAPHSPPARLLESSFARTMGTKQVRVYPWQRLIPGSRGFSHSGIGPSFGIALLTLVVVVVLGAGFVGGAFLPKPGPSPSPSSTASPSASPNPTRTPGPTTVPTPSLPPAISVVADATITTEGPLAMVTDGESLWVLAADGRIDRIDPSTQSVADSVTFGEAVAAYQGLAMNADGLWATDSTAAKVYRVDLSPLALATSIPVGEAPKGVLANADGVWVADVHGGTVLRIDPQTNEVVETVTVGPVGGSGPNWLAEGLGSIWVDVPNNSTITRIDEVTNTVTAAIDAPGGFTPCGGIAILDDAAWVTNCAGGSKIVRLDANSNIAVATIDMGGNGYNPIVINGSLWISVDGGQSDNGTLVRIDPDTNSVDRVLVPSTTFGGGGDIVVAAGSVWVMDGYNNQVMSLPMSAFAP